MGITCLVGCFFMTFPIVPCRFSSVGRDVYMQEQKLLKPDTRISKKCLNVSGHVEP